MRRKSRRDSESFTISFLDVASCGFGAMIILLMVANPTMPSTLEQVDMPQRPTLADLQLQLFAVRGETTELDRELNAKREQLSAVKERVARLQRDLEQTKTEHDAVRSEAGDVVLEVENLSAVHQSLSEEMQRLQGGHRASVEDAIAGIPVDSEYIIFVIDNSGSMQQCSWNRMLQVVEETLEVYPNVTGIQVMNDMGNYMFQSYGGQWIPDNRGRRQLILSTLRSWDGGFSNSSPVEGVEQAVSDFYDPGRSISIYVLGDDFSTNQSIDSILAHISRINVEDASGKRRVRIHAIAFDSPHCSPSVGNRQFFQLMRTMAMQNGGTFVALSDY